MEQNAFNNSFGQNDENQDYYQGEEEGENQENYENQENNMNNNREEYQGDEENPEYQEQSQEQNQEQNQGSETLENDKENKVKDDKEDINNENKEVDELDNLVSYENCKKNIESIESIDYLNNNAEKIQKIKLSENNIIDISQFFKFKNLIYLDLSHNPLSKLENLSPLINMEILILSNNNLKSIGFNLVSLKKLQHLDLGFNLLEVNDGSLIKSLKFNTELISLVLNGNINYDFEKCKYTCLDYLMKIEFLDTVQIVEVKKKKINMKNTYVKVTGKGGKTKKIKKLNDYIKFKKQDMENYKKEYEELSKKKDNSKVSTREASSYYYINLLNSIK